MPRGKSPKDKMDARFDKSMAGLAKVPQGYTENPEPKNKNKTKGMPAGVKKEYKENKAEAQRIIKARVAESKNKNPFKGIKK